MCVCTLAWCEANLLRFTNNSALTVLVLPFFGGEGKLESMEKKALRFQAKDFAWYGTHTLTQLIVSLHYGNKIRMTKERH